jgi:hypothetical protein
MDGSVRCFIILQFPSVLDFQIDFYYFVKKMAEKSLRCASRAVLRIRDILIRIRKTGQDSRVFLADSRDTLNAKKNFRLKLLKFKKILIPHLI